MKIEVDYKLADTTKNYTKYQPVDAKKTDDRILPDIYLKRTERPAQRLKVTIEAV